LRTNTSLHSTAFFSPFAFNCFNIPLNYASPHWQSLQLLEADRLSGRRRQKIALGKNFVALVSHFFSIVVDEFDLNFCCLFWLMILSNHNLILGLPKTYLICKYNVEKLLAVYSTLRKLTL